MCGTYSGGVQIRSLPDAMWLLILLNVVLLSLWFYRERKRKQGLFKDMGIRGPEPNFIFGNMHQLGNKKMCEAIRDWTTEYGSTYGYYEGPTPMLVTSDLDVLKQVYIKQFSNFYGRKCLPIQPDPATGSSRDVHMFLALGERWRHLRTVTNPSFTSAKMRQMSPIINKHVDEMVEYLNEKCQDGKSFDIYSMMQALTLDVIAECAFGMDVNSQTNQDDPFLKRCRALFSEHTHRIWLIMLGLLFPEFRSGWWGVHKILGYFREDTMVWLFNNLGRVIETRQNMKWERVDLLQLLLEAEVSSASRRTSDSNLAMTENEQGDTNNNSQNKETSAKETQQVPPQVAENMDSFAASLTKRLLNLQSEKSPSADKSQKDISALPNSTTKKNKQTKKQKISLTMDEVRAQSVLFLLAGYETTSTLLAYVTYELALNPVVQEKLQAEIDSHYSVTNKIGYDEVIRMTYLDMVICEALRIYPLAELVQGRRCMRTCEVEGMTIPEGVTIQPDIWSIHYDPANWGPTDTKIFEPERHTAERKAARHPMAFMAFGSGPKNCVGMRFALMETKIALVKVLRRFTVCRSEETQVPLTFEEGGTLTPKDGVVIKLEKRKDICDTVASPATSDYHSDLSEVFEE